MCSFVLLFLLLAGTTTNDHTTVSAPSQATQDPALDLRGLPPLAPTYKVLYPSSPHLLTTMFINQPPQSAMSNSRSLDLMSFYWFNSSYVCDAWIRLEGLFYWFQEYTLSRQLFFPSELLFFALSSKNLVLLFGTGLKRTNTFPK